MIKTEKTALKLVKGTDLTDYNPEKGLQTLAKADALVTHFTRAKDVEKLNEAVALKVMEQAKYIVWRDGVVEVGRPKKIVPAQSLLPDADPGLDIAHRWRKLYCAERGRIDSDKLAAATADAQERCRRLCEGESASTAVRGTEGTGEVELYTPAEYIEAARAVLGKIDLDPASNEIAQATVKATRYFTAQTDGLKQDWTGRVWLNPPYHRDLLPGFVAKLVAEVEAKRTVAAIMLTNNSTDTEWFAKAVSAAAAICFTHGRVNFLTPAGEKVLPTQGQAFFYYGSKVDRFRSVFSDDIGWIATP